MSVIWLPCVPYFEDQKVPSRGRPRGRPVEVIARCHHCGSVITYTELLPPHVEDFGKLWGRVCRCPAAQAEFAELIARH